MLVLYYIKIALRDLSASLGLSTLIVCSIAFGICATTASVSVFRAVSGDPIPEKSSRLFIPQIDFWGPDVAKGNKGDPPQGLDYLDAVNLWRDHKASMQSPLFQVVPWLYPDDGKSPFKVVGHAVTSEFFSMVDVPFVAGGPWNAATDNDGVPVAVISRELSLKLFGSDRAVGRDLNIQGDQYRIIGIINLWHPQPRFYDLFNTGGFTTIQDDVFIPFKAAIDNNLQPVGSISCQTRPKDYRLESLERSDCAWLSYMVQIDDSVAVSAYEAYLYNYASEQRALGRFSWQPNNRLRNLDNWLTYRKVVPKETKMSLCISFGLLLASMASTAGLLFSQFLRRQREILIRRALGASRYAVFGQFMTQAAVLGCIGGAAGVGLAALCIEGLRYVLPEGLADAVHLFPSVMFIALWLAVSGAMIAGFYPMIIVIQREIDLKVNAA